MGAGQARLKLLGTLALEIDEVSQPLGGPRQRAVLALLALEPNRTVNVDRIVVELWNDDNLRQPRNNVQVYVSNLRRVLRACQDDLWIVGEGSGYQLQARSEVIDLQSFRQGVDDAARQLGRGLADASSRSTAAALALWRGPFLDDLAAQFDVFSAAADRIGEERLNANEQWITAELDAGRSTELIADLEGLTARYPLHERFWTQLMTALWRAGRQSDALRAYQRARSSLADEAGLDPGPELRALEAALLTGELPALRPGLGGMALHFADAAGKARITPLSVSGTYTIGRHTTVDIPIEWDARASRVHARLEHQAGEWTITDCGSTNGTFVRGQLTTGTVTVRPGDVFIVGSTAFTLRSPGDERGLAWSPSEVTIIEGSRLDG